MAAKVVVEAKRLPSGAVNVQYRAGRYWGAVMFDENGLYKDATKQSLSSRGRGFVDSTEDLPTGVYKAAREARLAVSH